MIPTDRLRLAGQGYRWIFSFSGISPLPPALQISRPVESRNTILPLEPRGGADRNRRSGLLGEGGGGGGGG